MWLKGLWRLSRRNERRLAGNTFVCPKCGHRFEPKRTELLLSVPFDPFGSDTASLICPRCKKMSDCKIAREINKETDERFR